MNEKLEQKFKNLLNEIQMDSYTVEKIKNLREDTFNEIEEIKNLGFSKISLEKIKECTAFDRKTELKKEKYTIELFINFTLTKFNIEPDENIFKIKNNDQNLSPFFKNEYITPKFFYELIKENSESLTYDNNTLKTTNENVTLNIIPCIKLADEDYLVPNTEDSWKKINYEYYGNINKYDTRIKDILLLIKYCIHGRCLDNRKIDNFIDKTTITYYHEHKPKQYIYSDFYEVLRYIFEKRDDKIGYETSINKTECFAGALRKTTDIAEYMIQADEENSIKYFEELFGHQKY